MEKVIAWFVHKDFTDEQIEILSANCHSEDGCKKVENNDGYVYHILEEPN